MWKYIYDLFATFELKCIRIYISCWTLLNFYLSFMIISFQALEIIDLTIFITDMYTRLLFSLGNVFVFIISCII